MPSTTPGPVRRPPPPGGRLRRRRRPSGPGAAATGYLVGRRGRAPRPGPDQAGVPSGSLRTVLALRPSPYGGAAGTPHAGHPLRRPAAHRGPGQRPPARPHAVAPDLVDLPVGDQAAAAGRLLLPRRRVLLQARHRDHLQPRGQPHHRRDRLPVGQDPVGLRPRAAARQRAGLPRPARRRVLLAQRPRLGRRRVEQPHPVHLAGARPSSPRSATASTPTSQACPSPTRTATRPSPTATCSSPR